MHIIFELLMLRYLIYHSLNSINSRLFLLILISYWYYTVKYTTTLILFNILTNISWALYDGKDNKKIQ